MPERAPFAEDYETMPPAAPKKPKSDAAIRAIVGSDEAEIKRIARQAAAEMAPAEGGDFATDTVDGVAENADAAAGRIHQTIEALLTVPFFGGDKLVWLKNANFLGDSVMGRAAAVTEALEKLVATLSGGLPQGVRFLLSATEIDTRRAVYKTLGKLAAVEVYDKRDLSRAGGEEAAADAVASRARALGLRFGGQSLDLFVQLTGGETRQLENELEKLDLYLGPERREISLEDVRQMVSATKAGVIFELGNAIAARDLNRALGLVEQLLFQGESAIGIVLVAVIPTVRNLLLAKDLMQRHRLSRPAAPFHFTGTLNRLPADATAHLPRKKDGTLNTYALGIAATGAHRYELPELRAALEACLEANVALVSGGLEAKTLLTELVVRIIAPGQPAK